MDVVESTNAISLSIPLIQYGFAGFAFILLVVLIWCIKRLLDQSKDLAVIIDKNTTAINDLRLEVREDRSAMQALMGEIIRRPCIAKFKIEEVVEEVVKSKVAS